MSAKLKIFLPVLFFILNFLVKGVYLCSNSLAGDEPFSVFFAQMDLSLIITFLLEGNNPPLYEIILHFWTNFFGISECSVRLPSLIFSSISVVYIYRFSLEIFNSRVAIIASLLFIFSNYHIIYAHEARAYALFGMFSIVSMFYFLKLLFYSNSHLKMNLFLFIFATLLLIYTHYFGFFILFIQFWYLFMQRISEKRNINFILKGYLFVFLGYLPMFKILIFRFLDSSQGTWVSAPDGLHSLYNMIWGYTNSPVGTVFAIVLIIFLVFKFRKFYKYNWINTPHFFISFWFLGIFFTMFIVSFWVPMFINRYTMAAAVAYPIFLAIVLSSVFDYEKLRLAIVCIFLSIFIISSKPKSNNFRHVKETIGKIKELKYKNTPLIICNPDFVLNFCYYYRRDLFKCSHPTESINMMKNELKKELIFGVTSFEDVDLSNSKKVLFLDASANFAFPQNNILDSLNKCFTLSNRFHFYEDFNIYEFKAR